MLHRPVNYASYVRTGGNLLNLGEPLAVVQVIVFWGVGVLLNDIIRNVILILLLKVKQLRLLMVCTN